MIVTMVDKRIGKALAAAVYATDRQISICEVAQQAACQGLTPRDFDTPTGTEALIAIALALTSTPRMPQLPRAWEGAVDAALRIVGAEWQTARQQRAERRRHELQYVKLQRSLQRSP